MYAYIDEPEDTILWKPRNQATGTAQAQGNDRTEQCDPLTLGVCVKVASKYGVEFNVSDDPKQRAVIANLHNGYNHAIKKLAEELYSKQVGHTCIHTSDDPKQRATHTQVHFVLEIVKNFDDNDYDFTHTYIHTYIHTYTHTHTHRCTLCSKSCRTSTTMTTTSHIHTYIYIYIYIYIYTHTHIHTQVHFVLEIVQNCDDNDYDLIEGDIPKLEIEIETDALTFYNNERGFQEKNVMALSSIGESTKASSSGYIGVCMHACMCVCV
jgi:hypothetical protein